MATTSIAWQQTASRLQQFYRLTKPRVVSLIVFTAVIGMFLAVPGAVPLNTLIFATVGIAFVAGAAAAVNCLVEQKIDAVMARTRGRPLPRGTVTSRRRWAEVSLHPRPRRRNRHQAADYPAAGQRDPRHP